MTINSQSGRSVTLYAARSGRLLGSGMAGKRGIQFENKAVLTGTKGAELDKAISGIRLQAFRINAYVYNRQLRQI